MIGAFTKAIAQLSDGRVLKVIFISSVLAILVYALLIAGALWVIGRVDFSSIPWLDTAADWGAGILAVVIATLMFPRHIVRRGRSFFRYRRRRSRTAALSGPSCGKPRALV